LRSNQRGIGAVWPFHSHRGFSPVIGRPSATQQPF